MGIVGTVSVAAQALKAQQAAIQTISHNVANGATPGYARQRVVLRTEEPLFESGLLLGRGVNATVVRSVIDHFAEGQLLDVHSDLGFGVAEQRALVAIEEVFPTSGGIDAALGDFFASLSDLATNPSGVAERAAVIGKANALGDRFRLTRHALSSIRSKLDQDLESVAHQINALTQQIAALNQQVAFTEGGGEPANDARDERRVLLQNLAKLTGGTVHEGSDGQVSVLAENILLVSGNRAANLNTTTLSASGLHQVQIESPDGLKFDGTGLFLKGEIGAILQARDQGLGEIINQLDTLAKAVVDQVNTQHSAGFDYNGGAGGNFFQTVALVDGAAASVRVDSAVAADSKLISAAQSAAGAPGDNRNALALLNLRNTPIAALNSTTAENYFLNYLATIGESAQVSAGKVEFQTQLLAQVQARREATSGVSIDEEMTQLILFQRAFEASSRLISVSDEMYQTLIDMTR
jgi:flagellar hook-associated protein 1